jgi:hypothetical protein
MYIPSTKAFSDSLAARWSGGAAATERDSDSNGTHTATTSVSWAGLDRLLVGLRGAFAPANQDGELRRRSGSTDANLTVGIIVGVVLGIFLVGCFAFLWIYRNSIVFSRTKNKKRRKSSGSSKASSKASDSGAPPPPAEGG